MRYLSCSAAYAAWEREQEDREDQAEKTRRALHLSEGHLITRSTMASEPPQSAVIHQSSPNSVLLHTAARQLEFEFMSYFKSRHAK
jgi:hypothetical protein